MKKSLNSPQTPDPDNCLDYRNIVTSLPSNNHLRNPCPSIYLSRRPQHLIQSSHFCQYQVKHRTTCNHFHLQFKIRNKRLKCERWTGFRLNFRWILYIIKIIIIFLNCCHSHESEPLHRIIQFLCNRTVDSTFNLYNVLLTNMKWCGKDMKMNEIVCVVKAKQIVLYKLQQLIKFLRLISWVVRKEVNF